MGYTVNRGEKQSESSIGIDVENETSLSGNAPIGMGITSDLIGEVGNAMYNEKNGTWIGKDGKVRSMSWGGNQYTGGKNKFAKVTSQRLKFAENYLVEFLLVYQLVLLSIIIKGSSLILD